MKKMLAVVTAGMVAVSLVGCKPVDSEPVEAPETGVACYTKDGKFVKWDDDCHDDGLVVGPPKPAKTSGGLKTSGPIKPATTTKTRR